MFSGLLKKTRNEGYCEMGKSSRFKVAVQQENRPIDIKKWLKALDGMEDDDAVFLAKADLVKLLQELKMYRRKNSKLGGEMARMRREATMSNGKSNDKSN